MRAWIDCSPASDGASGVRTVVAVDDTDDETRATSTGEIANLIADAARELGGTLRLDITRHQLLLRDDVPYTSHNSAMAFEALMPEGSVGRLRARAVGIIAEKRAATSDPGLCVACVPDRIDAEAARLFERLVEFGARAKREFCSIPSAYGLARAIPWVALSEHGGTGAGVVGALAGAGLRLGGSDGRFRGKWDFAKIAGLSAGCTVGDAAEALRRRLRGPVRIVDAKGAALPDAMPFSVEAEGKPVLLQGALTVVCETREGAAVPCAKVDLGEIGNVCGSWQRVCSDFEWDNDVEECIDDRRSCRNCLHRRWVREGFECALDRETSLFAAADR